MIYPTNFEQKIGFTLIRQMLHDSCLSTLGQEFVERMNFIDKKNEIEDSLDLHTSVGGLFDHIQRARIHSTRAPCVRRRGAPGSAP